MSWLDIVILAVIAVATLMGLRTGIIKAVLSLAGLVIGVALAGRFYLSLSAELTFIASPSWTKIVAFAIILIGVMVVARVIANLLKRVASALMLGWVDKVGGAVFGLMLGAILCGAILALWINYLGIANVFAESGLALILLDRLPMVLALLPSEFDGVRSFFR
jgi:membrane protein required for colicin V production